MKACYRYGQICPKQAKTAQNSPFRGYSGIGAARSWLQEAPPRDPGVISQRGHFAITRTTLRDHKHDTSGDTSDHRDFRTRDFGALDPGLRDGGCRNQDLGPLADGPKWAVFGAQNGTPFGTPFDPFLTPFWALRSHSDDTKTHSTTPQTCLRHSISPIQ